MLKRTFVTKESASAIKPADQVVINNTRYPFNKPECKFSLA